MKSIIVFTTSYHPFVGGAEVAIEEIAKRLKQDFQFLIVTSRHDRKLSSRESRPEGTVFRVGFGNKFDPYIFAIFGGLFVAYKLKFGEWKKSYQNNEVLFWGVDISQGSLAAACASFFLPRIPFVLNLQYGYGDKRLQGGRFGLIQKAFCFMLRRATYVTAISRYLLKVARAYGFREQAAIVPNGVDLEKFTNHESRSMNHGKKLIILTVSRLVPKNGVDVLIDAVAKVKKEFPDAELHIIGDGPERKNLELQVARYKLQDSVSFFGSIPNEKVPQYMRESAVFVRPSRSEGMGISFIEALAAGLPIVGTPVGGIMDIIKDGETGLLAEPGNPESVAEKIIMLLKNPELGEHIVANGKKMASEQFSWQNIAEKYRSIFEAEFNIKKRIVLAAPLFPPDLGGPATYAKILLEEMPKESIGVSLAYFGDVRLLSKILRHTAYFLKVCLRARGRDTVFAQDPVSTGFPAFLAAKLLRKKFLLKVVGDYAWEQMQNHESRIMNYESRKNKGVSLRAERNKFTSLGDKFIDPEKFQTLRFDWKTELRRKIERFVAAKADTIIVPSNYLKKIVAMWGVSDQKIIVIPNAFDVPEVSDAKSAIREKLLLSGTALISVGRLVPWKGFAKLIEAMPRIIDKFSDAKLYIIGDGPDRHNLELQVTSYKLQDSVCFLGPLSHKEVLEYLRAGDIFILNTGYEGMSHVLLESMAMEIPIVTTNVCGNPEVIENGIEGILVGYNDGAGILNAVTALSQNKDLREKIIARAKTKVRQFSRERMISQTKEILFS